MAVFFKQLDIASKVLEAATVILRRKTRRTGTNRKVSAVTMTTPTTTRVLQKTQGEEATTMVEEVGEMMVGEIAEEEEEGMNKHHV